jgi:Skp family chaperone for outer membrane proteins
MRARLGLALVMALALSHWGSPSAAQADNASPIPGPASDPATPPPAEGPAGFPIVLVNQERLLSGSLYGQRIQREVEAAGTALAAENRQIEAQLTEEELLLTQRRGSMSPEAFRPLAQEFDARVEGIRAAQEAKSRALQSQAEGAQVAFFEIAYPVLIEVLRLRGAAVLMDSRAVLVAADGVDITDEAIARINAVIGEGGPEPLIDLDGTASTPAP